MKLNGFQLGVLGILGFTAVVVMGMGFYVAGKLLETSSAPPAVYEAGQVAAVELPPVWTPMVQPAQQTSPSQPSSILYGGPARRYVPITTNGMPSDFVAHNIEEFSVDDKGSFYRITFSPRVSLDADDPRLVRYVQYEAFLGEDVEEAEEMYRKTKEDYLVDDERTFFTWTDHTELSSKFEETGGFIGIYKSGGWCKAGRLIRTGNIVTLIWVLGKGNQSILDELDKELLYYTDYVLARLP